MDPDANNTVASDPYNLSLEELQEEYGKISKHYLEVKKTNDSCLQEIYELKRHLNTANAAERFLTQELESLQLVNKEDLSQLNERFSTQLHDTKHRNYELSNLNTQLELKVEELEVKVEKLEQELLERKDISVEISATQIDQKEVDWERKISELEALCQELGKQIEKFEAQINKLLSENLRLKERVECAEDNFHSKKEEIQEKNSVIDGLHEKIIELTAELNEIKNCPPEQRKKGNSLFAEVDDQRQLMKNILSKQKKQYMQMQKQFNEREYEIRRLKQENAAIHKEMEVCASIFTKADTNYRNELQNRIKVLLDEQMNLENKLKMNETLLAGMSTNQGMNWVDTIMSHCKKETLEMKNKYHNCLLEKSFLEENYMKSQQTLAKWRFEALKSRCIILDRENKLTEHKIPFESVKSIVPQERELQNVEPCVSFSIARIKQDEDMLIAKPLETIQTTSDNINSTVNEIKTDCDVKLDISTESVATVSPPQSIKSEQMDTSEDCSLSPSSYDQVLSSERSPVLPENNKNFSIFCDSIVNATLQSDDLNSNQILNSTIKIDTDTSVALHRSPPAQNVIVPVKNIKTELDVKPVQLEKSVESSNIKKKSNVIIRNVFIKSKKK